ncbi:hypothetical protein COY16_05820 [Candidatus Roizmanbacteria bacterium CG_4_10_14_0_2_um_filter_39_13]|uniref:Uncharacterized protein n=1 Tax=Candidatus Roizmanbacteria bacterium CG_4_10_14_0_2_um_filter_39_13 TaxID=1974825 RepID=A0A2M7TVK5_9BACT|nr:MAG: hypothetical protein COY16_05820 [Candidatus Roizmanbacteria bacterium CG_4_10_14_0_2_um_filter_39_13]
MTTEKIVGYSLLGLGIIFMFFATFQIVLTFTGRVSPIQIIKSTPQKNNQNTANNFDKSNPEELLKQAQQDPLSLLSSGGGFDISSIIDQKAINNMLNLTVHYFIMQFLLSLGYKLALLGVQMIRPLKISIDKSQITSLLESNKT